MLLSIPPRSSSRSRLIPGLSLHAGDVLVGRYRVMSVLRTDRLCAHLAAIQISSNTRVDVQLLLAMDDGIEHVHLRFLAEARKAAALEGPHVERVLHVGVTKDGHPFVVREASEGKTIAALLEEVGSLPTESAVDVALALCDALASAHASGLVHGAIDPTAVRLDWNLDGPSNVKLAELGTSRALAMLSLDARALVSLALRAPELLHSGREMDERADVWGVGVLLYTMLAGSPPFAVESPSYVNLSLVLDEPAMLAGVPDALAELVDACLAKDPAARPQTAAELASKLAPFGSHPVFEKRSSHLVVDTGPYDALVLERLVKEAKPAPSAPAVEKVAAPAPAAAPAALAPAPAPAPAPASEPPPARLAPSVPPVSMTLAPPAERSPAPAPSWRKAVRMTAGIMAVAAVLALGVSLRETIGASSAPAAAPAAAAPVAPNVEAKASPAGETPAASPSPSPSPASVAAAIVAATSASAARPHAAASASASAKPHASVAAPKPRAPEAAPAAEPVAHPAPAPIQPQPKANEDDLRRFLDDRR